MKRRDPFARFSVARPAQLKTKSDQWFKDATFLHEKAGRHAAALYLGGFVIECLLKAALWSRRHEKGISNLMYNHDLSLLLAKNVSLAKELRADRQDVYQQFVRLSNWNVRIRYNPAPVQQEDAKDFIRRLKEVRIWLRARV